MDIREKGFVMRVVRDWNSCPEKLRMAHHQKCAKLGWRGL